MNSSNISSNRKIASNTLMLYFRMLFSMGITLYTSRIILDILGVVDFGIYSLVGGIVVMLGFLNHAMTASTQRFLIFEIGKNDLIALRKVLNMSITIHVGLGLAVLLISETLGLWFLNNYLNIPNDRLIAANWVYHFSVFSFILTIISVPFNALIIAHEKMKVFALIGVFEVTLKLGVVFSLMLFSQDKLIIYASLIFSVTLLVNTCYYVYNRIKFEESKRFSFEWDPLLFKQMSGFAGWNLFGVIAGISYNQGVNILLNIFFGPTVNAARGIAFQVQGALNRFVSNFQVAVNPSITKSYAQENLESSFKLVFGASKFSYFLLLLLSMPILFDAELILSLWLKEVPDYTVTFTQLVIIDILIGSVSGAIQNLVQATGKIRRYQIVVSGILLLNLPFSYLFLKLGYGPEFTMFISILFSIVALLARLIIVNQLIGFPSKSFVTNVIWNILLVTGISVVITYAIYQYIPQSFLGFILLGIVTSLIIICLTYLFGLSKNEKSLIHNKMKNLLKK